MIRRYRFYRRRMRAWPSVKLTWRLRHQPLPEDPCDPYDYEDYEDGDRDCSHCGGQPDMQECDDPIQCCNPHCDGTWHPCDACNGTGRASQQWMW